MGLIGLMGLIGVIGTRWGRGDHLFAFEVVVVHFDAEYDPRANGGNCICEP